MRYTLDTEFIDTPTCSELISLAVVGEDGSEFYFEFAYSEDEITPWLSKHVVPHLTRNFRHSMVFEDAAKILAHSLHEPEFWAYYGSYDWYWLSRLFGGMMSMPKSWPHRFREFAEIQTPVPNVCGVEHNALNDAKSLMVALLKR